MLYELEYIFVMQVYHGNVCSQIRTVFLILMELLVEQQQGNCGWACEPDSDPSLCTLCEWCDTYTCTLKVESYT